MFFKDDTTYCKLRSRLVFPQELRRISCSDSNISKNVKSKYALSHLLDMEIYWKIIILFLGKVNTPLVQYFQEILHKKMKFSIKAFFSKCDQIHGQ